MVKLLARPLAPWHDRSMNNGSSDARATALDLFQGVVRKNQALDQQMAAAPAFARLDGRDRAFVHNLVATTLRRLGQIDALIGACLDRPLPKNAQAAQDILRLGTAQLLFTGTADHAAIDTAVDLARARGQGHMAKLVNALLRRLQREGQASADAQDAPRLNTPDWLWQAWEQAYGTETCRAIAESHQTVAPLDITVKSDPEAWAERLEGRVMFGHTVRLSDNIPISEREGFPEGAWWVQDCAAALPAALLGDVSGRAVLDLCAAPGGKTAQLAAAGAQVTALDRSSKRLQVLEANLARLGLSAQIVTADATAWNPPQPFDAILLDAPCSATGTIRRHPDLPHLKGAQDIAKLADLQKRLLDHAADWLVPGGVLVFVTCSLQPEEGPDQVRAFLAARNDYRCEAVTAGESGITQAMISPEGWLRTLPSMVAENGGMDGFFAARLRRIA